MHDQSKGEDHQSDKFDSFSAKEITPIKYVFPLKAIYPVHHACQDESLNNQNQKVFVEFQVGAFRRREFLGKMAYDDVFKVIGSFGRYQKIPENTLLTTNSPGGVYSDTDMSVCLHLVCTGSQV